MAWGMSTKSKSIPKIWHAFALETMRLDKDRDKPNGWHWLWALHRLQDKFPRINIDNIDARHSSDERRGGLGRIPAIPSEKDYFSDALHNLIKGLGEPKKIRHINFSGLHFKKDVNFSSFIFPVETLFVKTTFHEIIQFEDTNFQAVSFSEAVFLDYARFHATLFYGTVNFDKVKFSNCGLFNSARFYKDAFFTGATFYQKNNSTTSFSDAKFSNKVLFTDAKFDCDTRFTETIFTKNASFENTGFLKDVYFTGSVFSETADFKNAKFYGEIAKFKKVIFEKISNFETTTFKHYANFTDSKFYGRTSFQRAKFETHAPRFYEATLNKQIAWDKITWPKFPMIFRILLDKFLKLMWYKFDNTDNTDHIRENQNSYENLAYLMEGLGKYHDSHLFFRQEMRCRRKLEHPLMKPFYCFYQLFADYGYGIGRAFSWWLGHVFIGAIAIAIITCYTGLSSQQTIFCSISTSFANANPYVFIGFKDGGLTDCYKVLHYLLPIKFGAIRGVQTFIGIPLLFLLLTTLRVRFRLGGTTSNTTINNTTNTTSKK